MKKKLPSQINEQNTPVKRPVQPSIQQRPEPSVHREPLRERTPEVRVPELAVEPRSEPTISIEPKVEEPSKPDTYDYRDINSAPRNGTLIVVSETGEDKGEIVLWKRTRAFANATYRWEETGFFVHNLTGLPLAYKPKFWRMKGLYEI